MKKEIIFSFTILIAFLTIQLINAPLMNNPNIPLVQPPINYSLIPTVNNSMYLNGFPSSYFYPNSNPSAFISDGNTLWDNIYGFYNFSTLPATDLSNYYTKNETITNFSRVQYPYEENLVMYFSFNNLCQDEIQKNRTCVLGKSVFQSGFDYGGINGLSLNASKKYYNISAENIPSGNSSRTTCSWAKSQDVTTQQGFFSMGTSVGIAGKAYQPMFLVEGSTYRYAIGFYSSRYYASSTAIMSNTWYHLCGVVPENAKNTSDVILYVNGKRETKLLASGTSDVILNTSLDNVFIGTLVSTAVTGGNGTGSVDEIMIWNRNLSDDEIYAVYQSTKTAESIIGDTTFQDAVTIFDSITSYGENNHYGINNFYSDLNSYGNAYMDSLAVYSHFEADNIWTNYLYSLSIGKIISFANINFIQNVKTTFGNLDDSSIYYDGTNMIINPKEVGTGWLNIYGTSNSTSGGVKTNGYARTSTPVALTGNSYFDVYDAGVSRLGVQGGTPVLYQVEIDGALNNKFWYQSIDAGYLYWRLANDNGATNKTPLYMNMSTGKITLNNGLDVTGNTTLSNLNITGNLSVKRPYGMYSSTQDQTLTLANTAYPVTFNWTEDSYLITKQGDVNFSILQNGDYLVEISVIVQSLIPNKKFHIFPQIMNSSGVWNTVPRSNTETEIRTASSDYVIAVPFILDIHTNEKFRLMWGADDNGMFLNYKTNTTWSPETPSIIMTISKISETT